MLSAEDKKEIKRLKTFTKEPDYSCWKEWNKTVPYDEFLKVIKQYAHFRVGVDNAPHPFPKVYFKVYQKELKEIVRTNKMDVTYTVMCNPNDSSDKGTVFISKFKMNVLS